MFERVWLSVPMCYVHFTKNEMRMAIRSEYYMSHQCVLAEHLCWRCRAHDGMFLSLMTPLMFRINIHDSCIRVRERAPTKQLSIPSTCYHKYGSNIKSLAKSWKHDITWESILSYKACGWPTLVFSNAKTQIHMNAHCTDFFSWILANCSNCLEFVISYFWMKDNCPHGHHICCITS